MPAERDIKVSLTQSPFDNDNQSFHLVHSLCLSSVRFCQYICYYLSLADTAPGTPDPLWGDSTAALSHCNIVHSSIHADSRSVSSLWRSTESSTNQHASIEQRTGYCHTNLTCQSFYESVHQDKIFVSSVPQSTVFSV